MLMRNGEIAEQLMMNGELIESMWLNGELIYQGLRSCYGKGYWRPNKPWLDNEKWKDN
jgi:hypothetical protein